MERCDGWMEKHGMVWYDMAWYGMVWNGDVQWYGVVCYEMIFCILRLANCVA